MVSVFQNFLWYYEWLVSACAPRYNAVFSLICGQIFKELDVHVGLQWPKSLHLELGFSIYLIPVQKSLSLLHLIGFMIVTHSLFWTLESYYGYVNLLIMISSISIPCIYQYFEWQIYSLGLYLLAIFYHVMGTSFSLKFETLSFDLNSLEIKQMGVL